VDGDHWAGRVEQDALGVRAEQELANRGASPHPNDDEVSIELLGRESEV
jgi:hypothetical protein